MFISYFLEVTVGRTEQWSEACAAHELHFSTTALEYVVRLDTSTIFLFCQILSIIAKKNVTPSLAMENIR